MQNNSFSVLFFIKKSKLLKNGEAPICMRITVNSKRAEVQVKRSVEPDKWNHLKGCAVGKDRKHQEINLYLETVRNRAFPNTPTTGGGRQAHYCRNHQEHLLWRV